MYFISGTFILFLAVSVFLYYIVPARLKWVVLLAAGAVFYLSGGLASGLYLLFTAAATFISAIILDKLNEIKAEIPKSDKELQEKNKRQKKTVVTVCLILNFGMLFMLKYLGFSLDAIGNLLGKELSAPNLVMPLGVSFFIFQSIGYVIDVYRAKYRADRNFFKYLLFVSFFPLMIQGPISRHDKLASQLTAPHIFDADNLKNGIQRMLWGYFKKMVIADRAAVVVTTFFADHDSYGGAVAAFAVIMYCINLYCDFSGGIDITIGAARLFGITLEENFRRPIFSTSLAEYWRRWHITLGGWMRDYVFYPLSLSKGFGKIGKWARGKFGGKVGKILPTAMATFIVYFIIGIWHGASFRFIAYGFMNGAIITSSLLLAGTYSKLREKLRIDQSSIGWQIFSMIRTCLIVFIGRYITRSPNLTVGFELIGRTLNPFTFNFGEILSGTLLSLGLTSGDFAIIAVSCAAMLAVEYYCEYHGQLNDVLSKKNAFVQWLPLAAIMLAILLFGIMRGSYISSEFIYKQY
ncbi:MAG: MBOAT family protein [Ruminococcaceae bacterium]|nr:MBOAT family protein [Oscillospiraceae bacterium]